MSGNDLVLALARMKAARGMTTKDVSVVSGISMGTLNKIFSGQTVDPGISTIRMIVNSMGFTLDDLQPAKNSDMEEMAILQAFACLKPHQKEAVTKMIHTFKADNHAAANQLNDLSTPEGIEKLRQQLEAALKDNCAESEIQ